MTLLDAQRYGAIDGMPRVSPTWLESREPADAAARSTELVDVLESRSVAGSTRIIHDFGCGTGSMGRWLAPRLSGPQHWILYDRDPDLLARAAAGLVVTAADGAPVTVETRRGDVTRLRAADLAGAGLVTASALLDLFTVEEVDRVAATCVEAGCPALLTLSVIGQVELTPADPLDDQLTEAFNNHQRRAIDGRVLLGPDAVAAAVDAFARRGASTMVRPSRWRLGRDDQTLMAQWFDGWLAAACEHRPDLVGPARAFARRRAAELADGRLGVVVHHDDLLAGYP